MRRYCWACCARFCGSWGSRGGRQSRGEVLPTVPSIANDPRQHPFWKPIKISQASWLTRAGMRKSDVVKIVRMSPETIRAVIGDSNKRSAEKPAKYLCGESRALHCDYEFIPCPCRNDCWCK